VASIYRTINLAATACPGGVPKLSEQKLKKSDKKSSFVAWTDDEKKKFLKTVAPLNCSSDPEDDPGTRSLTAIDDFMQAMRYAEMVVKVGYDMRVDRSVIVAHVISGVVPYSEPQSVSYINTVSKPVDRTRYCT